MKKIIIFIVMGLVHSSYCLAQQDAYLSQLADGVKSVRQNKSSKDILNKTVLEWSATGKPKLALMDEIETDANEYKGKGVHRFKINQVVAYVRDRQNVIFKSKDDYFNSTEQNVFYSAIEKPVSKGKTVTYTITNHVGHQEFFFLSYDPKTKFTVTVNGKKAEPKGEGVQHILIPNVKKQDQMVVSITSDSSNKSNYDSFVILNHNPQK